jgi:aspartate/methionine/tyrosine aminotransferase
MSLGPGRRAARLERTLIRRIFDSAPPDAINLGLGQPDLPTPAPMCDAGTDAIRQRRTGYTPTAGEPALREAIARHYEPFASGPGNVVVTVGSQEAMVAALLGLVDPGDEVLYPDPGYPAYPVVAELVGAVPVAYPLRAERRFRIDPDDVESRLTARTRTVILCSPSNPTGAIHGEDAIERIVQLLDERGIPWVSDEIYAALAYDAPAPSPRRRSPEGGLIVSGLSKSVSMTGWRVGWIVGPEALVERLTAIHQYLVTCASSISQAAALRAFSPEGREAADRILETFRHRRARMARELSRIPGLSVEPPDGAFYFFVDVSAFGSSLSLARRILERRKVVTVPGEAFGERGRGYLRISFAARDDDIVRGVRAIGEELTEAGERHSD